MTHSNRKTQNPLCSNSLRFLAIKNVGVLLKRDGTSGFCDWATNTIQGGLCDWATNTKEFDPLPIAMKISLYYSVFPSSNELVSFLNFTNH